MAPVQPAPEKPPRKRKAHTKSRRGCKNCKLRGVKCDESKPSCEKCKAYGAACNYSSIGPDLEMVFDGAATIKTTPQPQYQTFFVAGKDCTPKPPIYPFLCPAVYSEDSKYCIKLSSDELERLGRFQTRTMLAIGSTKAAKFFQHIIIDIALASPCLMHVIQTITGIHDRYLSGPRTATNSRLTVSERYHLGKAAKLFNEELSKPIQPDRRDALWATAALMGAIAWATIEASKPEEAWPLTSPDPSDLMWIKMSENKAAIWEIAQPMRIDSIWHGLAAEYKKGFSNYEQPRPGIEGIPPDFVKLYDLNEASTPENHPYHAAVRNLTKLLPRPCTRDDIGLFIAFIAHFKPEFKELLQNRDPRAMLLVAYWYMKVSDSVWSLEWRSKLECQAICMYLEKYHWLDRDLIRMLQQPKKWCGASSPYKDTIWSFYTGGNNQGE